jgi:hypothetical protein
LNPYFKVELNTRRFAKAKFEPAFAPKGFPCHGLSALMERHPIDSRRGKNVQLPLSDLLRQSIYSRLAGHEDVNDAARLSQVDPE